ncbi:3900_t:CDS:2, partial [Paraglomus occultum]
LILKMNVTLNDALPVRLLSTKLIPSKAYEVTNSIPISSPITIFPRQQASFMYKLTHNKDVDDDEIMNRPSTQIHCLVEYRTLKDEIQHFAKEKLHDVLKSYNMSQHSDSVFENIRERFLELLDYHSYGIRDILDLGELDIVGCEQLFQNHGDVKGELVNAVREFWEKYNKITFEEVQDNGKNLKSVISFPIDVPLSKILNTVELVIPNSKHLVVGEPCHCVLVVRQSPYWNHKQQTEAIEFYYDVNVDFDNWLLSGQKKFCFSYKMDETREFPITLIPLKTGRLLVPFIRVASISSSIFSESVYINNAQQVLVRPRTQSATFFIEQQHRIHPMGPATGLMSGHHGGMMDEIAM